MNFSTQKATQASANASSAVMFNKANQVQSSNSGISLKQGKMSEEAWDELQSLLEEDVDGQMPSNCLLSEEQFEYADELHVDEIIADAAMALNSTIINAMVELKVGKLKNRVDAFFFLCSSSSDLYNWWMPKLGLEEISSDRIYAMVRVLAKENGVMDQLPEEMVDEITAEIVGDRWFVSAFPKATEDEMKRLKEIDRLLYEAQQTGLYVEGVGASSALKLTRKGYLMPSKIIPSNIKEELFDVGSVTVTYRNSKGENTYVEIHESEVEEMGETMLAAALSVAENERAGVKCEGFDEGEANVNLNCLNLLEPFMQHEVVGQ